MPLWWTKFLIRSGLYRFSSRFRARVTAVEEQLPFLSDRVLTAPFPMLFDDALLPDLHGPDTIHLAQSEPKCPFYLNAKIATSENHFHPQGLPELRHQIAEQTSGENGRRLSQREVLITSGATGALATVLDSFINPGDRVVLFDPTSPIFAIGLTHRRARIHHLSTWMEEGKIRFDVERFRAALRGAKMLVMSDPVNPTGGVFSQEDLEQIAFWSKKANVLIYLDESFRHFRFDSTPPLFASLPHCQNRILSCGSVSKSFGLSHLRVGWLTGCSALIQICNLTASLQGSWPSLVSQQLALQCLSQGSEKGREMSAQLKNRRQYVFDRLRLMGLNPLWPGGGFFFWMPVDSLGMDGRAFSRELLLQKRVLVNAGEPFGPSGKNFIRLSYVLEEGRLREGLHRLIEFVNERNEKMRSEHSRGARVRDPSLRNFTPLG